MTVRDWQEQRVNSSQIDNLIPTTFHSHEAFYETTVATHCSQPHYPPQITSAALHPGLCITGQAQHILRSPRCLDSQGYPSYVMAKAVPCTASCKADVSNSSVIQGRTPEPGTSQRRQKLLLNQHPQCCRNMVLQRGTKFRAQPTKLLM